MFKEALPTAGVAVYSFWSLMYWKVFAWAKKDSKVGWQLGKVYAFYSSLYFHVELLLLRGNIRMFFKFSCWGLQQKWLKLKSMFIF